jgi:hypothetical protein
MEKITIIDYPNDHSFITMSALVVDRFPRIRHDLKSYSLTVPASQNIVIIIMANDSQKAKSGLHAFLEKHTHTMHS